MKQLATRFASALLMFILGMNASSLWRHARTVQSSPAPVTVAAPAMTQPNTTPIDTAQPEPTPQPVFGGLKLVANQVQLKNEFLRYEVNVIYPQIDGTDALPIRKLNKHIERLVTQDYQWILNPTKEDLHYYKKGLHPEAFNSVYLDYEVVTATDSFLSIYFEGYGYGIGAAHSVQYSFVINYDLASKRLVKLADLFNPGSKYLELISEYCIEQLSRGEYGEHLWKKELAPVARNFESWNLTREGLRFNFDACKLFGCASGKQSVEIPFSALKHTRRNYGGLNGN